MSFNLPLLSRMSIGFKLAMTPLLSTLVLVGILGYTLFAVRAQESDALLVDLAGRQRMLNQRQMKEILLLAQGQQADYRPTRKALEDTLAALADGGEAVIDLASGRTVHIPPAPTDELRAKLSQNAQLIADFNRTADAFLALPPNDPQRGARLREMLERGQQVHAAANDAVTLLTAYSAHKLDGMLKAGFGITLVIALVGATFAVMVRASILRPLSRALQVLEGIARGDLTTRLRVQTHDELGRMAVALDRMIDDVHRAVAADHVDWDRVAAQRQELDRIRQMIESSPRGMLFADAGGRLRYVNPSARRLLAQAGPALGVAADALEGADAALLGVDRAAMEASFATGKIGHGQLVHLGGEALRMFCVDVRADGTHLGTAYYFDIITEQLRNETLAREAAEREQAQARVLREQVETLLKVVRAAASGDLTHAVRIDGEGAMAAMAEGLQRLLGDLRMSIREIAATAQTLAAAAAQTQDTSRQMGGNAQATSADAQRVAEAAATASARIETAAAAVEQMSASVREIARNTAQASTIARSAVQIAESANATMRGLGTSSAEIGDVVKVINSIAEQTNLLALNATIEAARAGEAGKGFAVVANEVKELAKETARATDDISARIQGIQSDSQRAVEAIGRIDAIINQVNDIQATVAAAVEQQTAVTAEITHNVAGAAQNSQEIAQGIGGVAARAQSTSEAVRELSAAADGLAQLAATLENLVHRFRC